MATLRTASPDDAPFLDEMLVAAAFWRPGVAPPSVEEVLANPELARYVDGWMRTGDAGLVAEDGDRPVGAAWWRFFTSDDRGYGFVAEDIPEVSLAVVAEQRGRGVGRQLLQGLIGRAQQAALRGLSLSVERDNRARGLYERLGFRPMGSQGGSVTMLLPRSP